MSFDSQDEYIDYMTKLGADRIPHPNFRENDSLLSHSIRVADLLYNYDRPMDEVKAGFFHSIYGNEFQRYKIDVPREEIQTIIGERSEHIVNLFCTLNNRVDTILYARGLKEPDKTSLRWLEYCNIKDQAPEENILKEFQLLLKVDG